MKLKAYYYGTINSSKMIENSFVSDGKFSRQGFESIIDDWFDIEDDAVVIDSIVDEDIENLDAIEVDNMIENEYDGEDEEAHSLDSQRKYTRLEAIHAMDILRAYMTSKNLPSNVFVSLITLRKSIQKKRLKAFTKETSISTFFDKKGLNN